MLSSNYSIWPKPELSFKDFIFKFNISSSTIEEYFVSLYPNSNAVLMPSARSSISAILDLLSLSREDYVWVPPYASHCVLNAISFLATPNPVRSPENKVSLVFHQWGFIHLRQEKGVLIEDSVDSLIPKGGVIFPNDGRFELFSLPKIFSTIMGGIILCQDKKDASELRRIRSRRQELKTIHAIAKLFSQKSNTASIFWENAEALNGNIPYWALNNIFRKITKFDQIIIDRKEKIQTLISQETPIAKTLPLNRLISCWPLPATGVADSSYIRHISSDDFEANQTKVLPIPLHNNISINEIRKLVDYYG